MNRRARAVGAGLTALVMASSAGPAAAHAIGGTFQLPVPLWLYLAGAGAAVAASFGVLAAVTRGSHRTGTYPTRAIPDAVVRAGSAVLRVIGLAWWYGAIAVGFLVGDISPLPALLFWVGIWVGLPIIAVLLGNPWPSLNPLASTFAGMEWVMRRMGVQPSTRLRYPAGLARWPAVTLLAMGLWFELVFPGSAVAVNVALLMSAYTLLTLAGMTLFGPQAWRNAELFEVELAWFGRIGPIGRHARSRRPVVRPWIVGLGDVDQAGASDAAFIVLLLAGVSYDGLLETAAGATLNAAVLPPLLALFGPTGLAFLAAATVELAAVFAAFGTAFMLVVWATRALGGSDRTPSLGATAGAYATTLLPIAAGYMVAHYLTLVIQGAVWLPTLLVDPMVGIAPALDWIPVSLVWYLSVAGIVGGHVAGVVLAHRLARRDAPHRAVLAGLPMVALMIGYTVFSLWIIAQPIVIEPGVPDLGA